jgi:hypothetical protein
MKAARIDYIGRVNIMVISEVKCFLLRKTGLCIIW